MTLRIAPVFVSLWICLTTSVAWSQSSPPMTSLRFLYPSSSGSWAVAWIAKEAKYFASEGLNIEFVSSFHLMARPEINKPEDLKGKKAGITTFGSTSDYMLRLALEKFGLDPKKDVAIIQMGGQPEAFAALQAGSIHVQPMTFPSILARKGWV